MKWSHFLSVFLIAACWFALQHEAKAEALSDLEGRIKRLAQVNDLMGDELEEVKQLRASANEHFLVFKQIIEAAQDDAVLNTAMSFAESAADHKSELLVAAAKVLSKRDALLFPLATQRALAILGSSGDKKHIPQVKEFASNSHILIRTAAETALKKLENKTEAGSTTSDRKSSVPEP